MTKKPVLKEFAALKKPMSLVEMVIEAARRPVPGWGDSAHTIERLRERLKIGKPA